MRLTYEIVLENDETREYYPRAALLLRKMANALEKDQAASSGHEGFSQGHNFECIKLTKVEPDAN